MNQKFMEIQLNQQTCWKKNHFNNPVVIEMLDIGYRNKITRFILAPNIDYDAQWSRVQNTIKSIPYLINTLKKLGFRTNILINAYNSYAVSHFTYSALMLTSCSEKAKSEIKNYHKNTLKIIGINDTEASTKYNLLPLEILYTR